MDSPKEKKIVPMAFSILFYSKKDGLTTMFQSRGITCGERLGKDKMPLC